MKRHLLLSSCLTAGLTIGLAGALTSPVFAQDTTAAAAPADASQEIVVTGFRSSLQKSLNLKKESIAVRDSIVAEDIGKFPELNIAEALQRIPGVFLIRDGASNEGQRISIRGLGSQYSVTTLNGAPIHTTSGGSAGGGGRDFNFDVFASELFGRVDFYKTPLAELEEGGIGGVIDLQTPRPFDKPGQVMRYAVSGAYNSNAQKVDPRASFLYSNTWGDFGVLVSYAHSESLNRRQGFQSTGSWNTAQTQVEASQVPSPHGSPFTFAFDYADPRTNLGSYTQAQVQNAFVPRFLRAYAMQNNRTRDGVTAAFEYKPNDRIDITLDTLFSKVTDVRDENTFGLAIRNSRTTNPAAQPGAPGHNGLVPISISIDANNNLEGTFGNTSYFDESYFYNDSTKFSSVGLSGKFRISDTLKVSAQIADSNSKAMFTGNRIVENLYGVTTTWNLASDPVYPQITSPTSFTNPLLYQDPSLQYALAHENDWEKSAKVVADWDYDTIFGIKGHLKAGVSRVITTKQIIKQVGTSLGMTQMLSNGQTFNSMGQGINQYMQPFLAFKDYTKDENPLFPKGWATFSRGFMENVLDANRANSTAPIDTGNSYKTEEAITSVFIQSDFTGQVFDRELRVNIGVRDAKTESHIDNYIKKSVAGVPTFVPNQRDGGYSNILPSYSMAYELKDNLIWRASYGKSITRASLSIIAANTVVPNAFNLNATAGNPDLKPQTADQYDTDLEWYFSKGSLLSFGLFSKVLKDSVSSTTTAVRFDTLGLDDSSFGNNQYTCGADHVSPGTTNMCNATLIQLTSFGNANKVKLNGYEFAYQQSFNFLPSPWNGLGALASYTHIDSVGSSWKANDGTIYNVLSINGSGVPASSYSLTGYYEKGPLAVRMSYNYRDKTILETGNNGSDLQRWLSERGILDASISYKVTPDIEVRLDGLNLNNAITYEYFKNPQGKYGDGTSRRDNALYDGRTIMLGVRGKL